MKAGLTLVTHCRTGQASPFVSGLEPPLLFWEAACVSREPPPTLRKSAEWDMPVTCESIGSPIDCEYFKVAIQRWRGRTQMSCVFWWARCCSKGRAARSNGVESGRRVAIKRQRAETKGGILMSGLGEDKEVVSFAIRSEDKICGRQ
jgi:hypothetical protein